MKHLILAACAALFLALYSCQPVPKPAPIEEEESYSSIEELTNSPKFKAQMEAYYERDKKAKVYKPGYITVLYIASDGTRKYVNLAPANP